MLSKSELYYLNSAIGNEEIFAIKKPLLLDYDKRKRFVDNGIKRLKEKKYLEENGDLTPISFVTIKALEKYNDARYHIIIDKTCVGIDKTDIAICIMMNKFDDYMVTRYHKAQLLYSILRNNEFIMEGKKGDASKFKKQSVDDFVNIYLSKKNSKEVLYLQKFYGDRILTYNVYFIELGELFKFDVLRQEFVGVDSISIRRELIKEFGMEVYINENKSTSC